MKNANSSWSQQNWEEWVSNFYAFVGGGSGSCFGEGKFRADCLK